jgi:predicted nucleic acid-binding protein
MSERDAPARAAGDDSSPDVPILHLGAMGPLHRRDIYDDVAYPGVLDANALAYALNADARQHAASRALLDTARDPSIKLYVTSQILCELYSPIANRRRGLSSQLLLLSPVVLRAANAAGSSPSNKIGLPIPPNVRNCLGQLLNHRQAHHGPIPQAARREPPWRLPRSAYLEIAQTLLESARNPRGVTQLSGARRRGNWGHAPALY